MAEKSYIEWTDSTWSPWMGCTKVSLGCQNCYAERWAKQYSRPFHRLGFAAESGRTAPLRWKKPRRVFVCSLSDFFHPDAGQAARRRAIEVMAAAPQHTYQILTKRPELIKPFLAGTAWEQGLPDNVWLGVTAENQGTADVRIPLLLAVKARVRFVSCEPMLGPVSLIKLVTPVMPSKEAMASEGYRRLLKEHIALGGDPSTVLMGQKETSVDWVICGGESGQEARPMHPEWARSLRDQCAAACVPFFFKQWGEWYPDNKGIYEGVRSTILGDVAVHRVGKVNAGRLLDGREHLEIPKGDK